MASPLLFVGAEERTKKLSRFDNEDWTCGAACVAAQTSWGEPAAKTRMGEDAAPVIHPTSSQEKSNGVA